MAKRVYSFDILAKLDDAITSVNKFANNTQNQLDSINFNTGVSALKDGFELVEQFASAAFDAIKQVGTAAIEEALEAEEAQVRLANALRLTGDFSQEAIETFDNLADSIQATTKFTGDATKSSLALAKQFRLTNEEAVKAVGVAADLAAIQGTSLEEATTKLSQTMNGFVDKTLAKTFTGLKSLSQQALVAGAGLDLIAKRVQGSAVALGDTFSGAVARTNESINDLLESLGKLVTENPQIIAGFNELQKGLATLNVELNKNGDSLQKLVTDGFLFLVDSVPVVIRGIQAIDSVFATLSASTKTFLITVQRLPNALLQAVTGSTSQLTQLKQALSEVDDAVKANERNRLVFEPLIKQSEQLAKRVRVAAESAKALDKAVQNIGASNTGAAERLADLIKPEDLRKQIEEASKEPFKVAFDLAVKNQQLDAKTGIAIGAGLVSNILKGAQGAQKLLQDALGAAANLILPGIGGAVSEIVGVLSQGPEKTKQMVEEFARAIPTLIENLADSLPVLIETLARELPPALAKTMPQVAVSFSTALIANMPDIVKGFAEGLIEAAKDFVQAIIDAIKDGAGDIFGGISGKDSGGIFEGIPILGGLGDILGFANGGRVPDSSQFRGDRFGPVMLDANEQVLNGDLTGRLEQFLTEQQGGGVVQRGDIVINMGLEEFARLSYEADRRGFRMRVAT